MNLVVLFLVVVWIALIAWTFLDARRRIQDPVLVACATGASLFPYVGTIVYSILRPPEFLEDAHERELEIRAAELRVRQLEEQSCPNCAYPDRAQLPALPELPRPGQGPVRVCEKPIDPRWTICPYCETPQRRAPEPPARVSREERPREERAPSRPAPRTKRPASSRPATARSQASSETQTRPRPTRPSRSSQSQAPTTKQRKPSSPRSKPSSGSGRDGSSDGRERPATAS